VNGDALDEADETFGISLSSPTNATIGDGQGVGTITDDDAAPVLTIADVSASEGGAGSQTFSFVVSLSAASGRTVTVQWSTADAEGLAGSDYVAASGTLTFAPGDTSETASVTVNGDVIAELDETFGVSLSSLTNATIGDDQATGGILDDEGLPVIDLNATAAPEGDASVTSLTFTVSLSHPSAFPVTVDWSTVDGTAMAGSDYVPAGGVVSFAPLDTSETVVVDLLGDATYELDETVAVELSNATNAPIGRSRRLGTIVNDDATPVVSIADTSILEGDAGIATLSLSLSVPAPSGVDASVDFATSEGTASSGDFVAESGGVTIPAGETAATIDIQIVGDRGHEADETFTVDLASAVGATIGDGTGLATIRNDDPVKTAITIGVATRRATVAATGILEPTRTGHRVTVTLYRRQAGRFVKVTAKTLDVKRLRDRDGDGRTDGRYTTAFTRPTAGGVYRLVARFAGTPSHQPSTKSKQFRLSPR
jgi:hypothetical protein